MMQEKKSFQEGKDKSIAKKIGVTWGPDSLSDTLELQFKQCSIETTLLGAGLLAATLANGGVNPWSLERVFKVNTVTSVLKIMLSCGM